VTDGADAANLAERIVHALVDALRLPARRRSWSALHRLRRGTGAQCCVILQLTGGFHSLDNLEQTGLAAPASETMPKFMRTPADLRGLDVHVHEGAIRRPEPVWRLAQRLPIPSTKSEASMVALKIAGGWSADHAGHQRWSSGDTAPAHQCWDHWHANDPANCCNRASAAAL
jgi:hypothetical protein